MKSETIQRLIQAKKYQKMALRALLPEKAAGHLDIIERACRALLLDCLKEMGTEKQPEEKTGGEVKKVTID